MHEQILRAPQVCERLGISITTLWRWRKENLFPAPKNLPGSSIKGWSESTVDKWVIENFSAIEEGK